MGELKRFIGRNFWKIVAIICLVNLILIYYLFFSNHQKEINIQSSPALRDGDESPAYSIKDNKGEIFCSESLRGKVKLFLFFSSPKKLATLFGGASIERTGQALSRKRRLPR